jgi:catecholate siderophore receptor
MARRPPRLFRSIHSKPPATRRDFPVQRHSASWTAVGAFIASTAVAGFASPALAAQEARPQPTMTRTADPQAPREFNIPAGSLEFALAAFAQATGIQVVVDPATLEGLSSPGVRGTMAIERALHRLLSATTLTGRFTSAETVTLDVAVSEFVEVSGRSAPNVSQPLFTEPLREIPQTITVVPAAIIEQQGASSLRDVLRNVAGITFQAGEGGVPAGDQLTIRGFSARTDMFVDGVRDFGGYSRDPFNLEQVEVAKGPSSAIAGRGSTGGAINLVTKTPHVGTDYAAAVSGGNADYKRTTIDVNQPFERFAVPGTVLRVNAMWTDTGVPGRDVVEGERWGVAPTLAFGVGTPTRLTASYSRLQQDNVPEYGLPWVPANTNPDLAASANGQPPVNSSNFYGLRARDYEDTTTDITTVRVDRDIAPSFTLRNLTRYGKTSRDSVITAPRFASVNTSTAINRNLQSRDMEDEILANQTSVTARVSAGATSHALVGGFEFSRETSENFLRSGPTAPTADLFAPNPDDPYPGPVVRTGARNTGEARSAAIYAFETATIGPFLELTGGVRWDHFDVEYESLAATGDGTTFARTDDMVSWRAGAVVKPRLNGSVYVGYGSSFNPSAEGLSLSATTATLDPEHTRMYEVGTKWDLAREQLSVNAAVFRTEKTNARTPGVNPGDPPTVLAGRQRVTGLEVGATGQVTDGWSAFAAYSFMRTEIAASNTPVEIDNALALTPEHTLSLWTTVRLPWEQVTLGGGTQYMDAVFRNAANSARVPSYWLVNALAEYALNRHLTLRVNVNNLTDADYVDRVGGGHYIPGAGRSIQVSTSLKY